MRIATMHLPTHDNSGHDLSGIHAALRSTLCESFGGFTATPGNGGWRSDTGKLYLEPVIVYSIAMDSNAANREKLLNVATIYGKLANQLAMMVTLPDGEVEFLDTATVPEPA